MRAPEDVAAYFAPGGPLAAMLPGYEQRPSQVQMALAVEQAIAGGQIALVEAPTGTGKSIAYLLPAILSGKTVVVATANKSLQHQLYTKDIPFLRRVLDREIDAVVVKGRSNYVCTHKWEQERQEQRYISLYDRADDQFTQVGAWLTHTDTGDVDDLPFSLNQELRPRIVSFTDDCLQRDCRFYEDQCWVNFMRDRAAQAQVIITNHHLLLNALMLGGAGERILPPAAIYVLDEAHQLEATATAVYETTVSDFTVEQLLTRTVFRERLDNDELDALRMHNTLAFLEAGNRSRENTFRIEGELPQMLALATKLQELHQRLKDNNPYTKAVADLVESASGVVVESYGDDEAEGRRAYDLALEALSGLVTKLRVIATAGKDDVQVRYGVRVFDRRHVSMELHAAPIDPAELLARQLFHAEGNEEAGPRTVICTSATLSAGGDFSHFKTRCGIAETGVELILPTVFDYPRQALLYQPPLPAFDFRNPDAYYDAAAHEIARLIEVSRGRTLCLFTSWSGLQLVADRLAQPGQGVVWPIRSQGDAPRNALMAWFMETPHSVLLATRSFWEGVDIPGDDLSLVVMDKLPFPTPNDPLHSARMKAIRDAGRDDFAEYMVPLMTLTLKQGFGRLVRRADDRGVVAILDERLSSKAYGRRARQDLPPARYSRAFGDVYGFFQTTLDRRVDYALNLWAGLETSGGLAGGTVRARWSRQLLRLSDGRADRRDGYAGDVSLPEAEVAALLDGLLDLRRRIEAARRAPGDYGVEVRCSQATVRYLETTPPPAWPELCAAWREVAFVPVRPG